MYMITEWQTQAMHGVDQCLCDCNTQLNMYMLTEWPQEAEPKQCIVLSTAIIFFGERSVPLMHEVDYKQAAVFQLSCCVHNTCVSFVLTG